MSDKQEKSKFYATDMLALCPYLEIKGGLKFVKAEKVVNPKTNKVKIVFTFLDPDNRGQDLAMEFRFSDEKRYRDCLFFYRSKIQQLLGIGE
jgi:hypothetical protein